MIDAFYSVHKNATHIHNTGNSRGGTEMTRNKVEVVMTEKQWREKVKNDIQDFITDKICLLIVFIVRLVEDVAFAMLILALPLGMVAHFLLSTGY